MVKGEITFWSVLGIKGLSLYTLTWVLIFSTLFSMSSPTIQTRRICLMIRSFFNWWTCLSHSKCWVSLVLKQKCETFNENNHWIGQAVHLQHLLFYIVVFEVASPISPVVSWGLPALQLQYYNIWLKVDTVRRN